MLSQEAPTAEMLNPQSDAASLETAFSVQTAQELLPWVWHQPHWDSRSRGASNLECSFLLRPCCILQNPCFLKINSSFEALHPLPVSWLPLAIPSCKQQKPQPHRQNVLSHRGEPCGEAGLLPAPRLRAGSGV